VFNNDKPRSSWVQLGKVSLRITDVARAEAFYGEVLGLPHVFTFGDLALFWPRRPDLSPEGRRKPDWKPGSVPVCTWCRRHRAGQRGAVGFEDTRPRQLHRSATSHLPGRFHWAPKNGWRSSKTVRATCSG